MRFVFVLLALATWVIGANLVVAKHYRRVGNVRASSPRLSGYWVPFPWKSLNWKEWFALLALAALTFALAVIGSFIES